MQQLEIPADATEAGDMTREVPELGEFYQAHIQTFTKQSAMIFAADELMDAVNKEFSECQLDGTFGVVPNQFTQLLTIHFLNSQTSDLFG